MHKAKALEAEVQAYHAALRNLGGAADEIEQLRTDLAERAEPAVAAARAALAQACAPYGLAADDLADPAAVDARVAAAIQRGRAARAQGELEMAEAREQDAARQLERPAAPARLRRRRARRSPRRARVGRRPRHASARRPAPTPGRAP